MASSEWELDVRLPPDTHVFVDHAVPLEVFLMREGELQADSMYLTVSIEGGGHGAFEIYSDGHEGTNSPGTPLSPGQVYMDKGSVRFWLVVKQGFMVRLCIAAADPNGICGPITAFKMITVYRYKLNVHTQPDAMFYKDEGGKNKCMTIEVGMEDVLADRLPMHQQDLSKALVVPFTTTLIYEDGNAPYQQEILTLSQDSDRQVTTAKSATVRFRIEEVSKNHRGNKFKLLLAADTKESPQRGDVAPCCTTAIHVLSKRKNINARNNPQPSPGTTAAAGRPQHGGGGTGGAADSSSVNSKSGRGVKRAAPSPTENHQQGGRASGMPGGGAAGGEPLIRGVSAPINMPPVPNANSTIQGMQREVSDAVKSLTEWIKEALAALHELQWELVGYEVGKDGKPDTKWPMYRCPSCKQFKDPANNSTTHRKDCRIAAVINTYNNTGNKALRVVFNNLRHTGNPSDTTNLAQHGDGMGLGAGSAVGLLQQHQQRQPARGFPPLMNGLQGLGGLGQVGMVPPAPSLPRGKTMDMWLEVMPGPEHPVEETIEFVITSHIPAFSNAAGAPSRAAWPAFNDRCIIVGLYMEDTQAGNVATMGVNFFAASTQAEVSELGIAETVEQLQDRALEMRSKGYAIILRADCTRDEMLKNLVLAKELGTTQDFLGGGPGAGLNMQPLSESHRLSTSDFVSAIMNGIEEHG
eukprot:TRINITY_DN3877_c0_g1_i1.p1 TRINITY_DN3877_c0_g1~~TRINITY_DN3877_c0_g1_i1.p1  ORF type:complete len:713 (-),score=134.99 TRINITY_DN3877_c0_g1_i1:254-2335(-)